MTWNKCACFFFQILYILYETGWAWTIKFYWENQTRDWSTQNNLEISLIILLDCVVAVFFVMDWFQNQEECSYEQTSRCTRYCFKNSEKKEMLCISCRVANHIWSSWHSNFASRQVGFLRFKNQWSLHYSQINIIIFNNFFWFRFWSL